MSLLKKQDFSDYKKTLEDLLQNKSFLYSGDVISSEERVMSIVAKHTTFSPELMKNVFMDIYNDSIIQMSEKSDECFVSSKEFKDIYQLIELNQNNSNYLFYSINSNLSLKLASRLEEEVAPQFLPSYFNERIKLMSHNSSVSAYFCPIIKDSIDEYEIFITDNPIQSLVWSLQNMTYDIVSEGDMNKHIVKYRFYNCDYKSTKFIIRSINKIRDKKLNNLLNDN